MAVKKTETTVPGYTGNVNLMETVMIDATTGAAVNLNDKRQYTLLTAATATGQQVGPISGGDYVWRVESTNFNGATATLQFLGLDGTTWYPVRNAANTADVALTATGSVAVGVSQGSFLRVNITGGSPAAMNSSLGGL
jgi:hypothetical protein